ncbi:MAG TPA: ATP-binding cassette domain-containing protein [Candidatus Hydrogenedens sp.]|mgnify:CR=1 FL=1|nr:ATP-binding cassette domain-containing protein [Candidatus Hydrogenedens sp.]HOL18768.1 ATP-binding cassette domain-containing protein [Candidatus Hydrogenedens sp.]HPP59080.1 ATP-binding cassette domain-containing protein [Candidatus Hydrogenedens sp.]
MNETKSYLEVINLTKHFPVGAGIFSKAKGYVRAVDRISFKVSRGETVSLVGESGSGKTTVARLILRLIEPTEGNILFDGTDLTKIRGKELRNIRRKIQIIFQDPYSSLNPRMTVYSMLSEVLHVHSIVPREKSTEHIEYLLQLVGLNADAMYRYPHEFSGGQRQRIGIARALAVEPSFIVADEPVSALDVSVQAQILNLLMELQEKLHLTYLIISHDLGVVRHISDRVLVMYLGKIVEESPTEILFSNPNHPYTQALLSAIPKPDPEATLPQLLAKGEPPSPVNPPSGCAFHPRCPYATDLCRIKEPILQNISEKHRSACWVFASDQKGNKDIVSVADATNDIS